MFPPPTPGTEAGSTDDSRSQSTLDQAERPARRSVTTGWSWILASAWGMVMACLGLVANTGWVLGGEPFWLDTVVLPFLLPIAVLVALAIDLPWALTLSWVAVTVLVIVGVIDLVFVAPAMGVAELVLATIAALVTLAAELSGRPESAADRLAPDALP